MHSKTIIQDVTDGLVLPIILILIGFISGHAANIGWMIGGRVGLQPGFSLLPFAGFTLAAVIFGGSILISAFMQMTSVTTRNEFTDRKTKRDVNENVNSDDDIVTDDMV